MNYMNYEGKSLVFSFLFMTIDIPTRNFPESRENPINGCERAEILCTFASETYIHVYIYFIPTRKPETHEKAIQIASEPKLLIFWGVKSDQKSETSEKNPEMIASEPKCSYFRVGFFFFFTTDQKTRKSRKSYIYIYNTDCERAEIVWHFWVWNTILLNILLINHMICRYNKLCPCACKS